MHILFLGLMMGTPLGLGGLPPQTSNGRKATWAMCPPENLRQLVIWVWYNLGKVRLAMEILFHHMSFPLFHIVLHFTGQRSRFSSFGKKPHFSDWRSLGRETLLGRLGVSSLLNEACSRPQLGKTWCCPCLAQVTYGETQAYICTLWVWVWVWIHASGGPVKNGCPCVHPSPVNSCMSFNWGIV